MEKGDGQGPGQSAGAEISAPIRSADECNRVLQTARFNFDRGQFEWARKGYERALEFLRLDSENAGNNIASIRECLTDLIDIYMLLNKPQEALGACEALNQLEPGRTKDKNYIEILSKTAAACERIGNLSAADAVYKEASLLADKILPIEDPLHAKLNDALVALHGKRNRDETLTASDKEVLRQVEQGLSMSGSRRGLKTTELEVKKASGFERKLPNFFHLLDHPVLHSPFMKSRWFSICVTVLLLACAGTVGVSLHFERNTAAPASAPTVVPKDQYVSCDNKESVTFDGKDQCVVTQRGVVTRTNFNLIAGSFSEFVSILEGYMRSPHEQWFCKTDEALQDESGTMLYAPNAPELIVAKSMLWNRKAAAAQFKVKHLYPATDADVKNLPGFTYTNPFTGKSDSAVYMFKRFAAPDSSWTARSKAGQLWESEAPWQPGKVHCVCLDYCRFLVRGFDRNGRPLTSSEPGQAYVLELKDGVDVSQQNVPASTATAAKSDKPLRVFIITSPGLRFTAATLRNFVPAAAWVGLIGSLVWFASSTAGRSRFAALRYLSFGIAIPCVAILIVWYYLGMKVVQ